VGAVEFWECSCKRTHPWRNEVPKVENGVRLLGCGGFSIAPTELFLVSSDVQRLQSSIIPPLFPLATAYSTRPLKPRSEHDGTFPDRFWWRSIFPRLPTSLSLDPMLGTHSVIPLGSPTSWSRTKSFGWPAIYFISSFSPFPP